MKRQTETVDEIAMLSGLELENRMRNARNAINRAQVGGYRDEAVEVDYCYLYREAELRVIRRNAHQDWLERQERHAQERMAWKKTRAGELVRSGWRLQEAWNQADQDWSDLTLNGQEQ